MAALPDFRIETFEGGPGITIKLGGELDSATCEELVSRFEQIAVGGETRKVVLDLGELTFIDSSGMRAIILVERRAGERGLALTILPAPETITELLQISGVSDRVPLSPGAAGATPPEPFIERIELRLARQPTAPAQARAELREAFTGRLTENDRATLTLLTSELVTNAVIHPDPGVDEAIGLRIIAYPDRVRVEVTDAGAGFDVGALPPRPRESGGHGLIVVEGLSSRWGTQRVPIEEADGFCVWFELDVSYEASAEATALTPAERSVAAAEG